MTRKYAADDAHLGTGAIVTSRTRKYSDLNLMFEASPYDGSLYLSRDAAAVKQSVRTLILTNYYERPFNHFAGAGLSNMLFENMDAFTIDRIESAIRTTLENHERRAQVIDVRARDKPDTNEVEVTLEFGVVSTREIVTLRLVLERVR